MSGGKDTSPRQGVKIMEAKVIQSVTVSKGLEERQSLKAKIDEMNARIKEIESDIENEIGQGVFHCDGYSITNMVKETSRFDTTRFKAEKPELYKEYCKVSEVKSFVVKTLKTE